MFKNSNVEIIDYLTFCEYDYKNENNLGKLKWDSINSMIKTIQNSKEYDNCVIFDFFLTCSCGYFYNIENYKNNYETLFKTKNIKFVTWIDDPHDKSLYNFFDIYSLIFLEGGSVSHALSVCIEKHNINLDKYS